MGVAPGVFLLTLALLLVILMVGLTSLSTTNVAPVETNSAAVLVIAALFGVAFFVTRRHRR